ncbi:hypothetical protein PIB30_009208 [Stylosanthes scabra]|uniref:Uncharacterized protein n=1 Tax=Stylosanthes scabra TaxID=79078 RepID=A0ABU6Z303_9FABA|nr:hypothetical protein [Stylosanthes scabra]
MNAAYKLYNALTSLIILLPSKENESSPLKLLLMSSKLWCGELGDAALKLAIVDVKKEAGFRWLKGDAGIIELCKNVMMRIAESNKVHIYVEHDIDVVQVVPIPMGVNVETIDLDDLIFSSDDGGYESAKDEVYKPLTPGYKRDIDSEDYASEG